MILFCLSLIDNPADSSRISQIFESYGNHMYNMAYSILKNSADAEDVVQDVFLKITQKYLDSFLELDSEIRIKHYLLTAARNTALNLTNKSYQSDRPLDDNCISHTPSDDAFIDMICNKLEYENVVETLKTLTPTYRDPMYLHFVCELSIASTAERLGRNTATVEKQINRGKKMLISILKEKRGD